MFAYEFMRNAFWAATFIAITCGVVGVYVVARNFSFLAHTLSEIGFAGAAFAILMGLKPLTGMLIFALLGSIGVGELSMQTEQKESSISAISAFFVGLGILFLSLSSSASSYATNILFGSIIGVSRSSVYQLVGLSVVVLLIIFAIQRPLNYDSFDHIGAAAHHINTGFVGVVFLVALAMVVFVLLTMPSSTARYLGKSIPSMLAWSVGLALLGVWAGLCLGYITNWPVTFFISVIEVTAYLLVYFTQARKKRA